MIRVLLVDDHPVVRTGYARLLEQAGDMQVVAEADSAEQALMLWASGLAVDLVITDLAMPGAGGMELIRRLLGVTPLARVLVFSMHDSAALVHRALEAGALGFVSKSSAPQHLVDAVRDVAAGRRVVHGDAAGSHTEPSGAVTRPGAEHDRDRIASLTEREFAMFRLLAQGHPLADCATLLGVSNKTASNYQTLIRDKLGIATSAALVHLAIRCGVVTPAGG